METSKTECLSTDSLRKDGIPTIVVASHCDHAPKAWRVEYEKIEKLCLRFKDIECFQTSINVSETHKRCVSIILRNVMLERHGKQPEVTVEQSHLSKTILPLYLQEMYESDKHRRPLQTKEESTVPCHRRPYR